jgi:hypothetical protein
MPGVTHSDGLVCGRPLDDDGLVRQVAHFLLTTLLLLWGAWVVPARQGDGSLKQLCNAQLPCILASLVVSRVALPYVARSHEKGVREAASCALHASLGHLLCPFVHARDRSRARRRGSCMCIW